MANTKQTVDVGSKARIFISYSRKDAAFADRLGEALKARDFPPLIDRSEIYAFEEWWKRIQNDRAGRYVHFCPQPRLRLVRYLQKGSQVRSLTQQTFCTD